MAGLCKKIVELCTGANARKITIKWKHDIVGLRRKRNVNQAVPGERGVDEEPNVLIINSSMACINQSFVRNKQIEKVIIPSTVQMIEACTFSGCRKLKDVVFEDGSKYPIIKQDAFENTPWLENLGEFAVLGGVLLAYQGDRKVVTIPSEVEVIGEGAISGEMEKVIFPENTMCRRLCSYAFNNCRNLKEIIFPMNLHDLELEKNAFSRCESLSLAGLVVNSEFISIDGSAFYECRYNHSKENMHTFYEAHRQSMKWETYQDLLERMEKIFGDIYFLSKIHWEDSEDQIRMEYSECSPGYHTETYWVEHRIVFSRYTGETNGLEWNEVTDIPCKASACVLSDCGSRRDGEIYYEKYNHTINIYNSPMGLSGYWSIENYEEVSRDEYL